MVSFLLLLLLSSPHKKKFPVSLGYTDAADEYPTNLLLSQPNPIGSCTSFGDFSECLVWNVS